MTDRTKIFTDLGKITRQLTEWLEESPRLDVMEQLSIENNLQMAQFTYATWKRRNSVEDRADDETID
jgi:hypothetical protein